MKTQFTYTAEESRAMLAKEREDYKSPKGRASWWQKDGAWHTALPGVDMFGKQSFLWTADAYDSREEAISAIEGDSPSPSLLPLVPPVGVTDTTLPASPVKDTPAVTELADLSPDARNFVLNAEAREQAMKSALITIPLSPASPVVPVEVPAATSLKTPLRFEDHGHSLSVLDRDGRVVYQMGKSPQSGFSVNERMANEIITACNSHAANLAKIKALEDAARMALNFENERRAGIKHEPADYGDLHETLRAALALGEKVS